MTTNTILNATPDTSVVLDEYDGLTLRYDPRTDRLWDEDADGTLSHEYRGSSKADTLASFRDLLNWLCPS